MGFIEKVLGKLIEGVMAASSFVLASVTLIQVVSRFIFKNPIPWGQDIVRLSFIYLVFWGGAYCVKEKGHLNIDMLLTALKVKQRYILEIIINLVLVVFFGFIVYYGFKFTQSGISQKAPYLDIPMSLYYVSLPSAGLLMIYYQILEILSQLKILRHGSGGGDIL